MVVDTTFDLEKKRNRPVKYDRELYSKTIVAMKKIQEIKEKREERFYKLRMRNAHAKANEKAAIRMDIAKSVSLVKPAAAALKEQVNLTTPNKIAQTSAKKGSATKSL
jgi:large subunit ribosomal protein L24e